MTRETEKLAAEALKLPPEGRAALAAKLIESLETQVDEDAEAAWSVEIAQRIADLESGKIKGLPWSEARRRILGLAGGSPKG
jgi:putative addiction module component (TIGR02574 family)